MPGDIWKCLETFLVVNAELLVASSDVAKYPIMHRAATHSKVNRTEAKKPCSEPQLLSF